MRQSITVVLAWMLLAAIFPAMYSCTDENIGSSLAETRVSIIEDSSFVITGTSVRNERLLSRTSTQLLGIIKSNGYGTLRSDVVTQFMPAMAIDTSGVSTDMIDSCRLRLRIPVTGGFTGDSLAPMRLRVYKLNKPLPGTLYSDFDASDYYDAADLLGETPYSAASTTFQYDTQLQVLYRSVSVPLPVSLAQEIFTEYGKNPDTFKSPSKFAQFFPGIYITNSFGSGRMMNYERTELDVYYRRHLVTDTIDSIQTGLVQTYLSASPEALQTNIIHLNVDDQITSMVSDGDAILMAPAGYEVQMRFPIQDVIDSYKKRSSGSLSSISSLELQIPVENTASDYDIAPPTYLLMVKTSMKDEFVAGDSLTNNKDSFYAVYDATNKCYTFSGMRDYILDILNNRGGVATEDDVNLSAVAVDISSYTPTSSYYYYGTAATSIVTKIAPQVSKPAIAKLRLDKAKVKITYSTLSMD
ncbi:MAG: DUF4270 family protein [Muribaculaceae bacterium]|nr:DUF4270 family protein [Muribaculaceae bacterium]